MSWAIPEISSTWTLASPPPHGVCIALANQIVVREAMPSIFYSNRRYRCNVLCAFSINEMNLQISLQALWCLATKRLHSHNIIYQTLHARSVQKSIYEKNTEYRRPQMLSMLSINNFQRNSEYIKGIYVKFTFNYFAYVNWRLANIKVIDTFCICSPKIIQGIKLPLGLFLMVPLDYSLRGKTQFFFRLWAKKIVETGNFSFSHHLV